MHQLPALPTYLYCTKSSQSMGHGLKYRFGEHPIQERAVKLLSTGDLSWALRRFREYPSHLYINA